MVALVRCVMNDMVVMASIWSWYTLGFTLGVALVGTILEGKLKAKNKVKTGIDRYKQD